MAKNKQSELYRKKSVCYVTSQKLYGKEGWVDDFVIKRISNDERELIVDSVQMVIEEDLTYFLPYYKKKDNVTTTLDYFYSKNCENTLVERLLLWKVMAPIFIFLGSLLLIQLLFIKELSLIEQNLDQLKIVTSLTIYLLSIIVPMYILMCYCFVRKKYNGVFISWIFPFIIAISLPFSFVMLLVLGTKNNALIKIGEMIHSAPGYTITFFALTIVYLPLIIIFVLYKPKKGSFPFSLLENNGWKIIHDHHELPFQPLKLSLEQIIMNFNQYEHYEHNFKTFILPSLSSYRSYQQRFVLFFKHDINAIDPINAQKLFERTKKSVLGAWLLTTSLNLIFIITWLIKGYLNRVIINYSLILFIIMILFFEYLIKAVILRQSKLFYPPIKYHCFTDFAIKETDMVYLKTSEEYVVGSKIVNIKEVSTKDYLPPMFLAKEVKTSIEIELEKGKLLIFGQRIDEIEHKTLLEKVEKIKDN